MTEESGGRHDWMPAELGTGSLVAGYRMEEQIGAGGMAVVFRARDEALGRVVAVKVLALELADDQEFRDRFIRESRAAAAVDHPHILPIYQAGEAGGLLYIAMRYVPGGDLRAVLREQGPLPAERVAFLLSRIASALDTAHAAGLVHRDVKPANILIDKRPGRPDHPYLSDFGLAKSTSGTGLTGTGQFLGTAEYAAPEQISGKPVPPRAQIDQYALACVAFTILTDSLPFGGDDAMAVLSAHMYDPPPQATDRRPDLPAAVDQVLTRALAKAPDDRYPACGDFADALAAALGVAAGTVGLSGLGPGSATISAPAGRQPAASTDPRPDPAEIRTPRWRPVGLLVRSRRARVVVAAAVTALAAGAAVGAVLVTSAPGHPRPAAAAAKPLAARRPVSGHLLDTFRAKTFSNLEFQPDGKTLVSSGYGAVGEWDLDTHAGITLPSWADATIVSPDGQLPAEADAPDDKNWQLWDIPSQRKVKYFSGVSIWSLLSLSSDGILAVQDGNTYSVDLWAARSGKREARLTDPDHDILTDVEISPNGKTVVALDHDSRLYIWDVASRSIIGTLDDPAGERTEFNGDQCATFSADNTTVAVEISPHDFFLWNIARRARVATFPVPFVAISSNGRQVAVYKGDGKVSVLDVSTGKTVATVRDPDGQEPYTGQFSAGGGKLAVGDDGRVYVWSIAPPAA